MMSDNEAAGKSKPATKCPMCQHPVGSHRNVVSYPDGPKSPGVVTKVVCTKKIGFRDGMMERCGCTLPMAPLEG